MSAHADLSGHRIEGYVPHAAHQGLDPTLSVPLTSEIEPNLHMGGVLPGITLGDEYRLVVSLYTGAKYRLLGDTERIVLSLADSTSQPLDIDELVNLADYINDEREHGTALVHCQAGLNRSGLLTALCLIRAGATPADAIALLREKRSPLVLCNEAFEQWLLTTEGLAR